MTTPQPQNGTPVLAGKKMSSSLRERLKRSSRYFSPVQPSRARLDESLSSQRKSPSLEKNDSAQKDDTCVDRTQLSAIEQLAVGTDAQSTNNIVKPKSTSLLSTKEEFKQSLPLELKAMSQSELKALKVDMETKLQSKVDILRKLNMVKLYREKNNLDRLEELIVKWRLVSQEAVEELVSLAAEPTPTFSQLIEHFKIDAKLIRFNAQDETFN